MLLCFVMGEKDIQTDKQIWKAGRESRSEGRQLVGAGQDACGVSWGWEPEGRKHWVDVGKVLG